MEINKNRESTNSTNLDELHFELNQHPVHLEASFRELRTLFVTRRFLQLQDPMSLARRDHHSGAISVIKLADEDSEAETDYEFDDEIIQSYLSQLAIPPSTQSSKTVTSSLGARSETTTVASSSGQATKRKASAILKENHAVPAPPSKKPKTDDSDNLDQPVLIAYCPRVSKLIQDNRLAQGVRFELARLVSTKELKVEDITSGKLAELRGCNKAAVPRINDVFPRKAKRPDSAIAERAIAQELEANSPWEELDREEDALSHGPYEGIGNNPRLPGWYGGKIAFRAKFDVTGTTAKLPIIVLDSCSLSTSSRFSRRFGSWSYIRVKIPLKFFHDEKLNLSEFFKKPFVLWNQVYRACYAKETNVFLYLTNESFPGLVPIPGRLSLLDFINWHNPLEQNQKQLMTKWSARMALGFSNSVPGPRIKQEDIFEIPDIVSKGPGTTESDMTDGCGKTNRHVHRFILDMLSLRGIPSAFQFRLAGYKGMSVLCDDADSTNNERDAQAWVRHSQTKIRYPRLLDPTMLTFDILRTSHMRTPSRIGMEVIVCLAENGVEDSVFEELLQKTIRDLVEGLTTWDGPDAMFKLWVNVERAGSVLSARRARNAVGEARVRGYSDRSPEDEELDEVQDDDPLEEKSNDAPRSTAWWTDYVSGCPSSLEETVMVLLDSGFTPQNCPMLREKLEKIVRYKVEARAKNIRFDIPESCIAFAVPDPYNVLGPDEIQIKSSQRNLLGNDGLLTDIITGDVLLTRSPCKLPSDIRKVKATDHPALRNMVDVIVFSVAGYRRLIDFLGGGDYDGDTVTAIWASVIVTQFRNADEEYSIEPLGLDDNFTRDQETGTTFLTRVAPYTDHQTIHAVQHYLLGALRDTSLVGKYSTMHANAVYRYGYAHFHSIRLAYIFCRVLDAAKNGWRINATTLAQDIEDFLNSAGPHYKLMIKKLTAKSSTPADSNLPKLTRENESKNFILDALVHATMKVRDRILKELDTTFKPLKNITDPDLTRPWDTLVQWSEREGCGKGLKDSKCQDLSLIRLHVQKVYDEENTKKKEAQRRHKVKSFTKLPIEIRQDILRDISCSFVSGPKIEELQTIPDEIALARYKASYAYIYDIQQSRMKGSRFPFDVATRELCAIKATAVGVHKVVLNSFYERYKLMFDMR